MSEQQHLEQSIIALKAQRAVLGDAVVDASIAALQKQLTALTTANNTQTPQRKQITVLFARVAGLTTLIHHIDIEEVSHLTNQLWTTLDNIVTEHQGQIDKHIGDTLMAIWGREQTQENDPYQAAKAALSLQNETADFIKQYNLNQLTLHIGINTGLAILGEVGSIGEYTAIGDTVNVASRLEHAAPANSILLTHNSYRHIASQFEIQPQLPLQVKGKAEPLQVYQLISLQSNQLHQGSRGVAGITTPLIGRDDEFAQLQQVWHKTINMPQAQLVTIQGEAGLGKSRLLYEFEQHLAQTYRLHRQQPHIFHARATQHTSHTPFVLIHNLFTNKAGIQTNDPVPVVRQKLITTLTPYLKDNVVRHTHFIGHLLGFDFSDSPFLETIRDDTQQIQQRAFFYMGQLFKEIAHGQPVVIIFEDVQWSDNNSLDFIEYLGQVLADQPLLIIALTRPTLMEKRPLWGHTLNHTPIPLSPLSTSASEALINKILRRLPEIPSKLLQKISQQANGNPFYIEELIKALIESGVIIPRSPQWQLKLDHFNKINVPTTLTGILQSRLDRLTNDERIILQKAAVIGFTFWDQAVTALGDDSLPTISLLAQLSRKEFVFPRQTADFHNSTEYIFKQALLRDVVYQSLFKKERRKYHAQAADWFVSQQRPDDYSQAARIAYHYTQAEQATQAHQWYYLAAQHAQATYAQKEAISYYQQALTTLPSQQWQRQKKIYLALAALYRSQANYEQAISYLQKTYDLTTHHEDIKGRLYTQAQIAHLYMEQGLFQQAREYCQQLFMLADKYNDTSQLAYSYWLVGFMDLLSNNFDSALSYGQESWALCAQEDDKWQIGSTLNLMGLIHLVQGDYDHSHTYLHQALAIHQSSGNRRDEAALLSNLGEVARLQGSYQQAITYYQQAVTIAYEMNTKDNLTGYLANIGGALIGLEQFETAKQYLDEALQLQMATATLYQSEPYRFLAQAYLGLNQPEEALITIQKGLELSQTNDYQAEMYRAWRTLGQVAAALQTAVSPTPNASPVTADYCFQISYDYFEQNNLERDQALTQWYWARYQWQQENQETAERHYQAALANLQRQNLIPLARQLQAEYDKLRP
ncbi:MAG TPA: adenylate/guanylate cyclase domain-containing protein [Anaerolineae bacterium]|nr:adenylate/guanylate cyclase domain-containing protein [Anaerolineae bacterium]